ncbi:MAG: polyprenyl synthetase family protein, partial [FCB group bacterium]|nr:polyprenyl synthetase family protein [FCB group bacterium]
MNDLDAAAHLSRRRTLIERALEERLPSADEEPRRIHEAMRYATLGAGKRLRPMLVLEVGAMADTARDAYLDAACALEFVHTASLILDDLPSMDDAALRRGTPATHTAFGEATAVLASLALVAMAFD